MAATRPLPAGPWPLSNAPKRPLVDRDRRVGHRRPSVCLLSGLSGSTSLGVWMLALEPRSRSLACTALTTSWRHSRHTSTPQRTYACTLDARMLAALSRTMAPTHACWQNIWLLDVRQHQLRNVISGLQHWRPLVRCVESVVNIFDETTQQCHCPAPSPRLTPLPLSWISQFPAAAPG